MPLGIGNNLIKNGGGLNPDKLALDLQFAADKAYAADGTVVSGTGQFNITSRKGPPAKFTRGSGATRVNDLGLIEWAPENLLLQSENFATTWTNDVGNVTITTDVATSPDGTTSADKIAESASTISRRICIQNIPVTSGTTYSYSCYIKAGERDFAQLATGSGLNNAFQNFILNGVGAGTLGSSNNIVSSRIDAAPNGWYRCTIVVLGTATGSTTVTVGPAPSSTLGRWNPYSSIAGSGILVWGAQLERHTSARAYIPTTTAAAYAPRFDHDPVTLESRGLLIEEQRQNLIDNSNSFNNWAKTSCTVDTSSVVTPEGSANAWKIVEDSLAATHYAANDFTPVSGTTYTASAWLKSAENGFAFVGFTGGGFPVTFISVNLSTGAVSTAAGTPIGATSVSHSNGWWRVSFSLAATASLSSNVDIRTSRDGIWANRSYLGNGVNGMYCYGAQVEAGSFATSYIPTTTSPLTRSADVCSISGSGFTEMWNALEGSVFSNVIFNAPAAFPSAQAVFDINDGTTANRLRVVRNPNSGTVVFLNTSANSLNVNIQSTSQPPFQTLKLSAGFKPDDFVYYLNNSQVGTDNLATMIVSPNTMNIGDLSAGTIRSYTNGTISAIRYYRKRLDNAKLQALTQFVSDPDANAYIVSLLSVGATVTTTQQNAINTFVQTGKTDGWWSSLKRLYLPIWNIEAPNAIDMVTRTSGTFVGTVNRSAGYVRTDGSTGYFNTGVTLSGAGCLQDSTALFAMTRFSGSLLNTQRFMGGQDSSNNTRAWIERYGSGAGPNNGTALGSATDNDNRYFFIRSRTGSAARYNGRYRNGTYETRASDTAASQGIMTVQNMVVMAINANGTIQDFASPSMDFCAYGFGLGVSEAQAAKLGAATQTLWETCTGLTLP